MRYFTASRGERSTRHVSVHRIVYGPPVRFVATCHRSLNLKWFRADGVEALTVDPTVPFKDPPQSSLDEFLATSFEGFHDGRSAFMCILHVNAEHARWVVRNLPEPMLVEHCADGVRLSVRTAGVRTLARFVVGLGGGARAESEELAAEVAALARGALHGLGALPGSGALDEARDSADGDKRTRRGGPTLARTLFTPGSVPPRTST
jgi:predicted DNA-binding transcriptional regulator YafY